MNVSPEVSRSSPARQWRSVDFPDPDAPMIAVNCRAAKSALIPSRARTAVSPRPYTLTPSMVRAAGTGLAGAGMARGDAPGALAGGGSGVVAVMWGSPGSVVVGGG